MDLSVCFKYKSADFLTNVVVLKMKHYKKSDKLLQDKHDSLTISLLNFLDALIEQNACSSFIEGVEKLQAEIRLVVNIVFLVNKQ